MTRLIYTHVVPSAMRLATLAITVGFAYAIADLFASLVRPRGLDADPTRIPRQFTQSRPKVSFTRKGNVMNKIIFATVTGLVVTTSTTLAQPVESGATEVAPISNALEIAIGGGYLRSTGDIGRDMASVGDLTDNAAAGELSVTYRWTPQFSVGVYGTLSAYEAGERAAPATDMGIGATAGVKADWHFRPTLAVDPWVSIGAGWRGLWLGNVNSKDGEDATERKLNGIELARVQFGLDYRISPTFALAPYIGAAASMFIAEDSMASAGYDEIANKEVNWSFTAGVLARFDVPFAR